jgi:hypothetical protein
VLTSCAFVDPLAIGSFIADGVMSARTGKGIVDTAVSKVAGKDCKLFRVTVGEDVCITDKEIDNQLIEKMLNMPCDAWRFEDDNPVCL